MGSHRFDAYTRSLAAFVTRRGLLAGLDSVLAMLLERLGLTPAAAKGTCRGLG